MTDSFNFKTGSRLEFPGTEVQIEVGANTTVVSTGRVWWVKYD